MKSPGWKTGGGVQFEDVSVPSNTAGMTHRGVSAAKLYVRQDSVA